MKNTNLLNLTTSQLQTVAYFKLSDVCSWDRDTITIKPIESWTDTQKLCAEILTDDNGVEIGVRCTDLKLEALDLLADRLTRSG